MSNKPHFLKSQTGKVTRYLWLLLAGVVVVAIILVPPFVHWNQQKNHWHSARPTAPDAASLSIRQALDGLTGWYKLSSREVRPTTLHLLLDDHDLEALTSRRNDALEQGFITSKHKQQLPAVLNVDGRRVNASVRLRGNQLDHVVGDKWSLKIYLKQGGRVNGIRRFSLQAPYTRSFQSEAIISDAMRRVGVLAPRIDYVSLVINGDRIGIMQMTEEFDAPLLESQGRRFGPLLQLDDSHTWEMVRTTERYAQNGGDRFDKSSWWNLYSGWRSANPKAYGKYSKRKKGEDLNAALSQWMAFTEDQVSPSAIFDIDAFVDFYIVCEYFAAHNLAQWPNTRLHYNTLTARFEPIAYDADLNFKPMRNIAPGNTPLTCLNPRNDLARTLMQDQAFGARWAERIRQLNEMMASDQFAEYIAERDQFYRLKLATDYPSLPAFDFSSVQQQYRRLRTLSIDDFALPVKGTKPLPVAESIPLRELPPVVTAYLGEDEEGSFLTLRNRIHADVIVRKLAYENQVNEELVPLIGQSVTGQSPLQLPVNLKSIQLPGATSDTRISLVDNSLTDEDSLSVELEIVGLGTQRTVLKPLKLPQPMVIPLPVALDSLLQRYPFLALDESGKVLQVATGIWKFDEWLILPRDITLVINAGAELQFAPNAGIVLGGDLMVKGSSEAPVVFDASDSASGWYGIFSHGKDSQITIKHASFNATRGVEMPGWRQRAGLLFHRANVSLEDVVVTDSCAEDAINLIRSEVTIKNVKIHNSCADALDIDASTGTISGLDLYQSGGDLLDFSESAITLTDSVFIGAGDKAISVGEASSVEIHDVEISESTIGLAVKDLSQVIINKANFAALDIGLMAFQKKVEYGPASIVGSSIAIDAEQQYVLEKESAIAIQGEEWQVTPFDLSDHY